MNLVVDIGNTRTKYAVFEDDLFIESGIGIPELYEKALCWRKMGKEVNVIMASTGAISTELRACLSEIATFFCEANPLMSLPIRLGYDTPQTLGIDRIAGCVAAAFLFPGKDMLVIDMGTAITFDFINGEGVFLGGNISPGMQIRFRALNEFTLSLPLVEGSDIHGYIGMNTPEAILNGVMNGILFEVRGYIDELRRENPEAIVILTGGASHFLKKSLKREVFFDEKLVIVGLNQMLEFQKRK